MSRGFLGTFSLASYTGAISSHTVRVTYTPQDGRPAKSIDLPGGEYMFCMGADLNAGQPLDPGIVTIRVVSPEASVNTLTMTIGGIEGQYYAAGVWYSDGDVPMPVPPSRMGWGVPLNAGGVPYAAPFRATNSGTVNLDERSSLAFGVDRSNGEAAPTVVIVEFTFTPQAGGPAVTWTRDAYGGTGHLDYAGELGGPQGGVFDLRARIDGVPARNRLMLTVSAVGLYAGLSWYAEDVQTQFWMNLVRTREVVS